MRAWKNKESGQLCLATEHWEPVGEVKFDEKFYKELDPVIAKAIGDRKVFHGCLIQVGWLLNNKNGIWFGLNMRASEQFEDQGDPTEEFIKSFYSEANKAELGAE